MATPKKSAAPAAPAVQQNADDRQFVEDVHARLRARRYAKLLVPLIAAERARSSHISPAGAAVQASLYLDAALQLAAQLHDVDIEEVLA